MAKSAISVRILPEIYQSIAFGDIGVAYSPVGNALSQPARLILFQNNTDAALFISWDGVNDHQYIPSQGFILFDVGTNKGISSEFAIAQGTQFYVREDTAAPTSGFFGFSALYAKVNP